jgi:hypothetical protein
MGEKKLQALTSLVFCVGLLRVCLSDVAGPATSFPKPGEVIENHIHANVHFDARKSSSFSLVSKKEAYQQDGTMVASYADRSYLRFLSAQDVVHVGPFHVTSRFGVIEHSESLEFRRCDGILGFGYSDMQRSACFLRTLTSPARPSWHIFQPPSAVILKRRQFAFLANEYLGELQLGGHDPASIASPIFYTPMRNDSGYGLAVSSIQYNGVEILDFSHAHSGAALVGILDTGSSCLMLPNSTYNGTYRKNPYSVFAEGAERSPGLGIQMTFGRCNSVCPPSSDLAMQQGGRWECCKSVTIPALHTYIYI